MEESWKRLTRQSENLRKHPNTLKKMEKKVFRWACLENNGRMWVYFILASLQWLPTKSRKLKGQVEKDVNCRLCLQLEEDNMSHMQVCPALKEEHEKIERTFQQHLAAWNVWTAKEVKTTSWAHQARALIQERFPHLPNVTLRILKTLAEGAYDIKPQGGPSSVLRGNEKHRGKALSVWRIPLSLATLLQEKLSPG